MSALAYNEPYKFSAGLLTLLAHVLFFSVLYFGVNWSVQQPQGMEVDLWADLPETDNLPPPVAPPAEAQPAPPQKAEPAKPKEVEKSSPPTKAEIDMAEKKKKPVTKPKEVAKPEPKKLSKYEQKRSDKATQELVNQSDLDEQKDRAKREAQAAAGRAAITSEVDKYRGLISAKIRHNIVMPPDVADDAVAEFAVTLLPDGGLLGDPKLHKSSGNTAYDEAVERAIRKAEPLPLPQDETARKQFINPNQLKFKFSPKDKE